MDLIVYGSPTPTQPVNELNFRISPFVLPTSVGEMRNIIFNELELEAPRHDNSIYSGDSSFQND